MKRTPLKRKTRLKPVNPKRAKARKARDFGEYAEWIRHQPCVIKGRFSRPGGPIHICLGPIVSHHVRSRGADGHAEANLVSLCDHQHRGGHVIGWKTFAEIWGVDLKAIAASLWATYQAQTGTGGAQTEGPA
jgi:hypothetical protein